MRRPALPPRSAALAVPLCAALTLGLGPGCAAAVRCDAMACAPVCPRDAARDASGGCACVEGTLLLLGACVPPSVGDAYCGPSAMLEGDGCAFRACPQGQRIDVATGACVPALAVRRDAQDATSCADGGLPLLEDGHLSCAPADATCPRGARRASGVAACERSPHCPPGSLVEGNGCRAIVTAAERPGGHRVDVGAWAAIVIGFDGGAGSRELCQPLQQRAASPAVPRVTVVEVAVSLRVPDQDISRVRAEVQVETMLDEASGANPGQASRTARPDVERLVSSDVGTLLEALRGLGGEATAAAVDVRVRCVLAGSPAAPRPSGPPAP